MKKSKRQTVRFSEEDIAIIGQYKGKTLSARLHNALQDIPKLKEIKRRNEKQIVERALTPTSGRAEAFDYEGWYCDCGFGTYLREKRKVFCRCTYLSIKRWLPGNRLVDPQVCDDCLPKVQRIEEWLAKKSAEVSMVGELHCSYNGRHFNKEEQIKVCRSCTHTDCPHHPRIRM